MTTSTAAAPLLEAARRYPQRRENGCRPRGRRRTSRNFALFHKVTSTEILGEIFFSFLVWFFFIIILLAHLLPPITLLTILIISRVVQLQPLEKEQKKFFVLETGGEVFDPRIVQKQLAMMIDEIKIFTSLLVGLSLDVRQVAKMGESQLLRINVGPTSP